MALSSVSDLANGKVPDQKFQIVGSRMVWDQAFWARGHRMVRIAQFGGKVKSVRPSTQVRLLGAGFGAAAVAAFAPAGHAIHDAHMRCGGDIRHDAAHVLRHANRNVHQCALCADIVAVEAAKVAKAEASIRPAVLAGPDVAEVVGCGHDGLTLAKIIAKAIKDPHGNSVMVDGKEYPILGRGVSRVAVDLKCGSHVVKVEYGKGGGFNRQAEPECKAYQRLTPEQRNDVARIFAWTEDFKGVVFEKAFKNAADLVRALKIRAGNMGFGDLHDNNLGFRANGQPIVLDFGL